MDLSRVEIVIGKDAIKKLQSASVAVVGLGGVGSYVAESLARSGIGNLLLVDSDFVASSNINRQLPALQSTMGMRKTIVLRDRLLDIQDRKQQLRSAARHSKESNPRTRPSELLQSAAVR